MKLLAIVALALVTAQDEEDEGPQLATELTCADEECLVRSNVVVADDGTETYTEECVVEEELADGQECYEEDSSSLLAVSVSAAVGAILMMC